MNYERLTFTLSLPRSRTAWMARFFGYAIPAWRDPLAQCESIDELARKIDAQLAENPRLVVIDTVSVFFIDELLARFPGARYLVVLREPHVVRASLKRLGVFSLRLAIKQEGALVKAISKLPPGHAMIVPYDSLDLRLPAVWLFVTGGRSYPTEFKSWAQFAAYNRNTHVDIPLHEQEKRIDRVKVARLLRGII